MYRVSPVTRRGSRRLAPQIVLSLAPANADLQLGHSTVVRETFVDDGVIPITGLRLSLHAQPGWRVKRLGRPRAFARVGAGHRVSVAFRVRAPRAGPPVTLAPLAGTAAYDPPAQLHVTMSATLGVRAFAPVRAPFRAADNTGDAASFGISGAAIAIRARGTGVFQALNAPPTDSYAAVYERGRAGAISSAQVTVTSDPAGGPAGGAGLIEREDMTASAGSPAGVVLFVNGSGMIAMSWNALGGRDVDSRFLVPNVFVHGPVTLRLDRNGSTYTGYYSTNGGLTWAPVDTVTVAGAASTGNQDLGVFHASGLTTWTTTATFSALIVR
jgi:hypothetical protein